MPVLSGLSDTELALAEAVLGSVQLPPDLRELLALGRALGGRLPGLPAAVAAVLPLAPGQRSGRAAPPPLVPLCGRHYVPATPCLAGNPVFHMSDSGVTFVSANTAEFLLRAGLASRGKTTSEDGLPRWGRLAASRASARAATSP